MIYVLVVIYWSIVWELSEDDVRDMTIITTLLPLKLPTNTLIQTIKHIPRSSSKLPSDPPLIFSQISSWCYGKNQSQDRDDSIIPYLPFVHSSLNNCDKISEMIVEAKTSSILLSSSFPRFSQLIIIQAETQKSAARIILVLWTPIGRRARLSLAESHVTLTKWKWQSI